MFEIFTYRILILFLNLPMSNVNISSTDVRYKYTVSPSGTYHYYTSRDVRGCTTKLSLSLKSSAISLISGGNCDKDSNLVESSINSFKNLVNYYGLENMIKSKQILYIDIVLPISHWPLIKYINNDNTWPVNIIETLEKKYPDKNTQYKEYIKLLRGKVLHSNVYFPFTQMMLDYGCDIELNEYFSDPIFYGKKNDKKKQLIEWGVFEELSAKKEIYPSFKGPISFSVNCKN